MSEHLIHAVATIVSEAGEDVHWTVVLDRALRGGTVPPGPEARPLVISALAEATTSGLIEKTSVGTYRAPASQS
ncbi:MAG: hypothetical protein NVSMB57_10410 [Actinomycetota bacterium]